MEKQSYLSKSRYLLLFLFALIVGTGSAWADAYNEGFNSSTSNSNGLTAAPTGWTVVGTTSNFTRKTNYYRTAAPCIGYTSAYGSDYLITPEVSGDISFWILCTKESGTYYGKAKVYEYDGSSVGSTLVTDEVSTNKSNGNNQWKQVSFHLDYATRLAIQLNYAYIDDFSASNDGVANGPALAVFDGSTKINTNASYDFGNGGMFATASATKTFTLKNAGTEAHTISIKSETGGFSPALSNGGVLAAKSGNTDGSITLTLTMPAATASGVITLESSSDAIDDFVINVSGTIQDPNKAYLNFSDGKIPDGWTSVQIGSYGSAWSASTGYISQSGSSSSYAWAFTSPKMNFTNGEKIFFETAKYSSSNYNSPSIKVEYTTDATGATGWTAIGSAFTDDTYGTWTKRSVTIPVDGVKRIRFNGWYIYMRNIYGGELPIEPKNLAVSRVGTSATFTWGAANTETAWQVYIDTDADAISGSITPIDVATTPSKTFTGLTAGSTYYVWVRSNFGGDSYSDWVRTSFSLTYRAASPTSVDNDGITNVTFGSGAEIVNYDTSKSPYYQDNSAQIGGATVGQSSNLAITFSTGYGYGTVVWVDWNKNYEFEDSEIVYAGESGSSKPTTLDASFIVPALQATGNYRMRIAAADSYYDSHKTMATAAGADPYPTGTYCVVHDYTLKVNEAADYAMSITGSDVSENTIAFGTVKNTTTTKTFTIKNDGGNVLTHVSVVSSDAEVFTVSDTDFEIAKDGTKEITVTFVKGVEKDGGYSETITVSQANIATPIELTVTGTYVAPTPATIAISEGATAVGATVAFGTVGKAKSKTFTVANSGETTLTITNIESNNTTDFTVSPSTLNVDGGQTGEFIINFLWDGDVLNAEKSATITLTSNAASSPTTFTVTGTRADMWTEDFSSAGIPDGWEDAASAWTFAGNGEAVGSYNNGKYLYTPSLTVEAGQSMTFEAKKTGGFVDLIVYYSKDNGDYTLYTGLADLTTEYQTYTISGLAAGNYRFRINDEAVYLKNFEGFKLNVNDPTLAVYSNSAATDEVSSGTTKDFGWAQSAQSATYYIKNGGTGTLTISSIAATDGFTAATAGNATTVAAGADPLALTVTMSAGEIGEKSGTVTLTTDGGNFTIPVKGFIYGDRNLVDFTNATQYTGWTTDGWTISEGVATVSSTNTMQTTKLLATANENLYVEAKSNGDSWTAASLTYSYSIDNGENWTDPATIIASTTSSSDYTVYPLSDIAATDAERTVLIRFAGTKVAINRIYGFEAIATPVMALDKTADKDFGMQTAAAEYVITVTNNGTGDLENLAAVLTTGTDYSVEVSSTTVAPTESATITVTQKASTEYASHSDVLTISADGVNNVVINLSGKTRDGSKSFADFETVGMPVGWTYSGWSREGNSSNHYAQSEYSNISSLLTPALTIAAGEEIKYDAWVGSAGGTFKVRYTTNGGISWTEADVEATTTQTTKTLSLNNVEPVTAYIQFVGNYRARIDNFYGGTANDNAPLIQVTKSTTAVANGDTEAFGDIQAQATANYTITNAGTGTLTITSPITTVTGVATAAVDVASLGAGESATLTITMPVEAPYGEKSGAVTVQTNLGNFVINYTATTMNPNALNIDFSDAQLPAGWYNDGWTVDSWDKLIYRSNTTSDTYFMTQKLNVAGTSDVLKFDAKKYGSYYASSTVLKVSYSTDRVNWTEIGDYASEMTTSFKTFEISGLSAGDYYLKFEGRYASIDNIIGWTKVTGIDHDLYVTATSVPKTLAADYTATATVTSLRAAETGVYAKLFFGETEVATATAANVALNGSTTFTMTATEAPTTGLYKAKIVVYYSDGTIAFTTGLTNVGTLVLNQDVAYTAEPGEYGTISLTYTKGEGKWGTIALPFETTITELGSKYSATINAYQMKEYDGANLVFENVTTLEAGKPYIIYSPEAMNGTKEFSNKAVTVASAGSDEKGTVNTVTFTATFAPMNMNGKYGVTPDGKVMIGGETSSLQGFRGYLTTSAGARLSIVINDEATGIKTILAPADVFGNSSVYNLKGQKVQNAKRGLYIVNGKKVVVK